MTRRGPRDIETTIQSVSDEGLGEGTFECRSVRARNALPGERVTVRVLKRRRGVWYGEAQTPAPGTPGEAAPQRQTPPCPAFPRCGGCAIQHLKYPEQLALKQRQLQAQLAAHHVVPGRIREPAFGPQFHYRYKARLGVRLVGDELLAGFREAFSSRVVRMSDCKTLALPFARLLPVLQDALAGLEQPARIPQVELAGGDREHAIIVRHLYQLSEDDHDRLRRLARQTGMRVFLQPAGYDSVWRFDDPEGAPYLQYTNPDLGLCYDFLPTDFTQVNPFVNRLLVRAALLALAPRPGASATDLFCGIGNFALALARLGVKVRGYESVPSAVERARHNAARNGLSALAEFAVSDLYDARCPDLPVSDYLLLDPPRSGAGVNLERWVQAPGLRRIAYVSCSPRTFASDAARLDSMGFTLREVGIFDMFPHTAHIETLGLFVRRPGAGVDG